MEKSKNGQQKKRISVQFKFIATFLLIIAATLIFLNIYPVITTRDLVFSSKQSTLRSQAQVIASSLSALETLSRDSVGQVMELLDTMSLSRVIVTDDAGLILYDTSDADAGLGRYALFSEIYHALQGNMDCFISYDGDAFSSLLALPVRSCGTTIGAVYLYDYDTDQADLLAGIVQNLRTISLFVGVLSIVLVIFFSRALTRRITALVRAIRVVRDGEYSYRLAVGGNDELTDLGEEFNNLTERLQQTEELRRRFVSDASHELKTPLAAIRLLSDSIVQSQGMDTDTIREFVTDIGSEAERLQRTTEKLLSLTRLDGGEVVSPRSRVDIKEVAQDTLRLLKPLAQARDVQLEYTLSDGCYIWATRDDIYQIIFNLVENGIKYNLPGGTVRLLLYTGEGQVHMVVDDTGIGIPQEDMPHIFSRFYRVDKARSREAGGSGLGLSIVHDTVVAYNGQVEVTPREPRGTRFSVTFPIWSGEEGQA